MEKEFENALHFTHNDADAVGCALLLSFSDIYNFTHVFNSVSEINEKVEQAINNWDILYPDVTAIFITDISVNEKVAALLDGFSRERNIKLILIDHHETNKLYKNYDWVINNHNPEELISDEFSATGIINSLMNDQSYLAETKFGGMLSFNSEMVSSFGYDLYTLATDISRYDTWLWKTQPKDYSEDFTSVLTKQYGPKDTFEMIRNNLLNTHKPFNGENIVVYDTYKISVQKSISNAENKIRHIQLFEYDTVGLFIADDNVSEVSDYLLTTYPDFEFVIGIFPDSQTISLRSKKDDLNVARIAKLYGGGGHQKAAGAKLSNDDILNFLKEYYENEPCIEKVEPPKEESNDDEETAYNIAGDVDPELVMRVVKTKADKMLGDISYVLSNPELKKTFIGFPDVVDDVVNDITNTLASSYNINDHIIMYGLKTVVYSAIINILEEESKSAEYESIKVEIESYLNYVKNNVEKTFQKNK